MSKESNEMSPFIQDIEPLFYKHSLTYVDVGAFKGETFQAIAHSGLKIREAHLLEPHPKTFDALKDMVDQSEHVQHVRCHNVAVGAVEGILQLSDEGSMSRVLGYKPEKIFPSSNALSIPIFEVKAITLDALVQWCNLHHISLLKIDVEGHEIQVFEGAAELLKNQAIDMVYVEAGFDPNTQQQTYYRKIEDLLNSYNYHLFKIYEQKHEWIDDNPRLRRVNLAFMSDVFAACNPYQLSQELFALKSERETLKEQIQSRDHSLSELQEQLQVKEHSISELEEQLEAQKDLTHEYFTLLTQAEKEQAELQENFQELRTDLQKKMEEQQQLVKRYFLALAQAETEQEQLRNQVAVLQHQSQQYLDWLQKLQFNIKLLLKSRRWRLGNAVGSIAGFFLGRGQHPTSIQRILKILNNFEEEVRYSQQKTLHSSEQATHNIKQLFNSIEQLHKHFQAVIRSRRWRLGHALVSFIALLLRRPRHPVSVEHMQDIFYKFQDLKRSTSPQKLSPQQIGQLQTWMTQLENDYKALLKSRRWRLGNFLCSPANILFWRGKRPKAVDRMQEIFEQYKSAHFHY